MKPLKFNPLLKQTIWGGDKIIPFKHLDSNMEKVGESWEISGVKGMESIVNEGEYRGMSLSDMLKKQKGKLVGEENYKHYGNEFPLLIKFIDAQQDLSIQVHPNDEVAHNQGIDHGKTEMWYIMDSEPTAKLRLGLKKHITPSEYKTMVENGTICDAIDEYRVKEGDCFFIPAGRIHSTGAGCFLAEIQQTSDVTYRIYDFNRKDKDGNYRKLHTKEAAESIDFSVYSNYRTDYVPTKDRGTALVQCPYFKTAVYDLENSLTIDYSELDSFVVLIALKGEGNIKDNEGNEIKLNAGETILIPATTKSIKIDGKIKFIETYV